MATIIKNEVLVRAYIVLLVVVMIAVTIYTKAFYINVVDGARWRAKGDSLYVQYMPVEPLRGNIMAEDGSLLATSLPYFEVRMDPNATGINEMLFTQKVDSLAMCIASVSDQNLTAGGWRDYIKDRRLKGERYLLIKEKATIEDLARIKKFPIFRNGRNKGGLIVRQLNNREHPFGLLARRTVGYVREEAKPVGLEGYYNDVLGGEQGQELMMRVGPNTWIPMNDLTEIQPQNGDDLLTTLDINLQDIAQEALIRGLEFHDADHGCAVLMEVKTGAIKAISNIGKTQDGWSEKYNYAVGTASEPGSTFKLASIMALLEDGHVRLEDTLDLNYGKTAYCNNVTLEDAEKHGLKRTTVKHAFELSSNVGISRLVERYYGGSNAIKFTKHLKDFNLDVMTGVDIGGEASPYIKDPVTDHENWACTTLPWMSIGYEMMLTPIQLLTFYNAVANEGEMMKPYLVKEVQRFGETVKIIKPEVIKRRIASVRTIAKVKELLAGVVTNGTAQKLRTDKYNFSGKTGTTQINYRRIQNDQELDGYQASFVGYFPSENPVYSCIIVVNSPKANGYYGAGVAGPIFREIADKAFTSKTNLHNPINTKHKPKMVAAQLPSTDVGNANELKNIFDYLDLKYYQRGKNKNTWATTQVKNDSLKIVERGMPDGIVPNVLGMRLKDALYLLENRGLRVDPNGFGVITKQSLPPGTKAQRGAYISLALE